MFLAALISRSCRVPQAGHAQWRVPRLRRRAGARTPSRSCWTGYQRSTAMTARPERCGLVVEHGPESAHPVQEIARASERLRTIPATFRSSTAIASNRAHQAGTDLVQEILAGIGHPGVRPGDLDRSAGAVAEPFWQRASRRCHRLSRHSCRSQSFGCGIFSPVDRTAKWVRPMSTPALPGPGAARDRARRRGRSRTSGRPDRGPGSPTWDPARSRPRRAMSTRS